jgi:LysR family transcriptional regulator, nitrogen assimilation regulatory protein
MLGRIAATMTLKELQIFTLLAELGSVANVANSLGIAQSAVSRQIADIEANIGQRLFHRTGRGLVATEFAQSILPRAVALLVDMRRFADDAKAGAGDAGGVVTIGFVPGVTTPLSSLLVNRLRESFPGIQLNIFEGYSGEIESWLATSKIDIGVLNSYRSDSPMRFQPMFSSDIFLVGAAGSSHINGPTIDFDRLGNIPLVFTVTPSNLTILCEKIAQRRKMKLRVEARSDSARALHDLVANSGLHAPLPYHAVATQLFSGAFTTAHIVNPTITQKVVLATSTHHPLSTPARQVTKVLLGLKREMPTDHRLPSASPRLVSSP